VTIVFVDPESEIGARLGDTMRTDALTIPCRRPAFRHAACVCWIRPAASAPPGGYAMKERKEDDASNVREIRRIIER
jgi:hypothetical protein